MGKQLEKWGLWEEILNIRLKNKQTKNPITLLKGGIGTNNVILKKEKIPTLILCYYILYSCKLPYIFHGVKTRLKKKRMF